MYPWFSEFRTPQSVAASVPSVEEIEDICVRAQQYREAVGSQNPWEHDFAVYIHALLIEKLGVGHE